MGKRKYIGISIAVLVALFASSSLSVAQGPVRINESFVLGGSGCQMNLELDGDEVISANLGPAFESPAGTSTVYSYNFTGTVSTWTGAVPFGAGDGTPFSGTLTYDPSTFALGATTSDSQVYLPGYIPAVGIPTIPSIFINFDLGEGGSQTFLTSSLGYSSVINDRSVPGTTPVTADMYDFYSSSMSSQPLIEGVRSVFFLRDDSATALTGLAYPTNLDFDAWGTARTLQVYVIDNWQINGTLTSLTPAGSPPSVLPTVASPTIQQSTAVCEGSLPIEQLISDTLVCEDCVDDGNGYFTCDPLKCQPKTFVERNIMEKSGDGSTFCYYTTTGQRVCKNF